MLEAHPLRIGCLQFEITEGGIHTKCTQSNGETVIKLLISNSCNYNCAISLRHQKAKLSSLVILSRPSRFPLVQREVESRTEKKSEARKIITPSRVFSIISQSNMRVGKMRKTRNEEEEERNYALYYVHAVWGRDWGWEGGPRMKNKT
jgi:hypothetical protein